MFNENADKLFSQNAVTHKWLLTANLKNKVRVCYQSVILSDRKQAILDRWYMRIFNSNMTYPKYFKTPRYQTNSGPAIGYNKSS